MKTVILFTRGQYVMGNSISAVVCNRGLDLIGDRPLLQVCNLKKVLDCLSLIHI